MSTWEQSRKWYLFTDFEIHRKECLIMCIIQISLSHWRNAYIFEDYSILLFWSNSSLHTQIFWKFIVEIWVLFSFHSISWHLVVWCFWIARNSELITQNFLLNRCYALMHNKFFFLILLKQAFMHSVSEVN